MQTRCLKVLSKLIQPRSSRLWKGIPEDTSSTTSPSRIQIFDNLESFVSEAQKIRQDLSSDYLTKRIKKQKNHSLELIGTDGPEHLLFVDTSKLGTQQNRAESQVKAMAMGQSKAVLARAGGEKNRQAELVLRLENGELARNILQELEYHNYRYDLKIPKSDRRQKEPEVKEDQEDEDSEEGLEFGNKLKVKDIFVDCDGIAEGDLEEINVINNSVALARNLVNARPNILTPSFFAENVKMFAESRGLRYEIQEGQELLDLGLNMHHAVGRGANTPPVLVIAHYDGNPEDTENR